jgi:hypothetical protein
MERQQTAAAVDTRPIAIDSAAEVWRELASRHSGGVHVRLYWRKRGDRVFVHVKNEPIGESFVLEPPKEAALSAFYHPYALRSSRNAVTHRVQSHGTVAERTE